MSTDQTEYEIFVSYARLDNTPVPATHPHGWVTGLRDFLVADQRRNTAEPLRIFFDTSEIRDMDRWPDRLRGALRSSKVLLVCLSPNYEKSGPCLEEWADYRERHTHHLLGGESIGTVYLADVPRHPSDTTRGARHDELMRYNFTDMRKWFSDGPAAMDRPEVREKLDALGVALWRRVERARRARRVRGNVRRSTPFFVGRRKELGDLHGAVGVGAIGVVTAVHGLGGMGKTELAYHYANGYADSYPLGLWSLAAEKKTELLPLLGNLAFVPEFEFTPTEAERNDPVRLGRAVLAELRKRYDAAEPNPDRGVAALVILDNVSEPELLGPAQLATLGPPANWLRLIATTRLGPERLAHSDKFLTAVPVGSLDEADALKLIRDHLPNKQFPNAAEESAAKEIVRELGGFTLAVEQVAVYLGVNAGYETPSAYLKRLRAAGLPSVDALGADADVAAQMFHQEKQLAPILRATLDPLAAELPAALTALRFAALLPPDTVPWPWLQALTTARHPELADNPVAWGKIERRLKGLQLLTEGEPLESVARIHRLVAAHLRKDTDAAMANEVREYVANRARAVYEDRTAPMEWELDSLVVVLPVLLELGGDALRSRRDLALGALGASEKVLTYRSLRATQLLLVPAHELLQRLADSDRGNAGWQRDVAASLSKLGDVAVALGNLPAAQAHYAECHAIRQRLADSDRGNAGWQRGVAASLSKLGDVAVALGNLPAAQAHYAESLAIRQRLAASDRGNAEWQRDVWVSHWKIANLLEQQRSPQAMHHWRQAHDILARMLATGLHVSPNDRRVLEQLKAKIGG